MNNKSGKSDGDCNKNKAVYTTAPVAGGWAGAVMSSVGAVRILKVGPTDRPTDGLTVTVTCSLRYPRQKGPVCRKAVL